MNKTYTISSFDFFAQDIVSDNQFYKVYSHISQIREKEEELNDPVLEQYYQHIHDVFIKKLADFNCCSAETVEMEKKRLRELFEEMIRIKDMIHGEDA